MYNKETFTYGAEIEWGDIDRRMTIPPNLGKWEYAETDIVNLHPPFNFHTEAEMNITRRRNECCSFTCYVICVFVV